MRDYVLKEFLKTQIVPRTIVFADALGLTMDSWHLLKQQNGSYQVNFFSNKLYVGHILIKEVGNKLDNHLPLKLYTPFGPLEGVFDQKKSEFSYVLTINQEDAIQLTGKFGIDAPYIGYHGEEPYFISSEMTLEHKNGMRTILWFNVADRMIVMSGWGNRKDETLRVEFLPQKMQITHFNFPECINNGDIARIELTLVSGEGNKKVVRPRYKFMKRPAYFKDDLKLENGARAYKTYKSKMGFISAEDILQEIELYDERMLEFIDEMKMIFTLSANGLTDVCIFDRMAKLCFHPPVKQFFYHFLRPADINVVLDHNPILKKMNESKK